MELHDNDDLDDDEDYDEEDDDDEDTDEDLDDDDANYVHVDSDLKKHDAVRKFDRYKNKKIGILTILFFRKRYNRVC
jgi:hypothetical protein